MNFEKRYSTTAVSFEYPRDRKVSDLDYLRAWASAMGVVVYTPTMELMDEDTQEFVAKVNSFGFVENEFKVEVKLYRGIHSIQVNIEI